LRIGLALGAAVVVVAFAPEARRAGAAGAPVAVDAAIVLAADVSRSIDDDEFALQRRGYADAIQSQQLLDAVSTGPHGAIALAYVEWAGDGEDKVVVDWAVIRNQTDAQAFTAALTAAPSARPIRNPRIQASSAPPVRAYARWTRAGRPERDHSDVKDGFVGSRG